ncbi:hypothetical protein TNCV_3820971 [Trichonephila clavipes]|nr:hypothetical protein TNCV_3820971 [Trichonephila clavipes]
MAKWRPAKRDFAAFEDSHKIRLEMRFLPLRDEKSNGHSTLERPRQHAYLDFATNRNDRVSMRGFITFDGGPPVPKDCNCNFYICPVVVYNERNSLGASLTPPKRVTRFPRLEEDNVPINTSWFGMFFGNFPSLGEVIDRERISLR